MISFVLAAAAAAATPVITAQQAAAHPMQRGARSEVAEW